MSLPITYNQMFLILVQFTIIGATYTYVAKNDGNLDGWLIYNGQSPFIQNCGDIITLGGINSFNENTIISRMFSDLNPHYQIRIDFQILIIDSSSITDIEVELDEEYYVESVSSQIIQDVNYCGLDNKNEQIKQISFILEHTKGIGILFVKFKYDLQQRVQWGIKEMHLNLDLCSSGCSYCIGPNESDCQNWYNYFFYLGNTLFTNQIIVSSQISEFSQYYECQKCDSILMIEIVQTNKNTPIQLRIQQIINEDLIIEVYDDGTLKIILIEKYGIAEFNFRLYSRQETLIQTQIQYQIKYHVNENLFPFIPGCLQYFNKECIQCQEGWEHNIIEQLCQPICGNNKIEGYEECDDGNNISYDGCFECTYQCIQDCMNCKYGICEECVFGFKLETQQKRCLPICGDGIVVPFTSEYCDDGNQDKEDGCFNCMYECIQFCSICMYFDCIECQNGFYLKNGVCNPECGDKIVVPGFEECDDGNDIQNDKCHECKLVCDQGCEICQQGQCKINCDQIYGIGFYYINQECKSMCGDGIITIDEDCDDGNNIEFDGCFNCKYSCKQDCLDCKQGQCLKYQNICGDGILQGEEQCDDGNKDSNDGCFNCMLESGWNCKQIQQISFCNFIYPPQFISKFLSIQNNKQQVLFQFSQEIKVMNGCNLTESMILQVLNIQNTEYTLTFIEKQEPIEKQVQEVYYLIQIEINTQIDFKPILSIDLNATILNNQNEKMEQQKYQLTLEIPLNLNEQQKNLSMKIQWINSIFLYGLIIIGAITLLLGQPAAFLEILDLLQFFSFFKYIIVSFPQNLEMFFEISNLITISYTYNIINFQEIFNLIIPFNQINPQFGKFPLYKQNADLLSNIITQMILCLTFLLCMICRSFFYRLIYKIVVSHKFIVCMIYLSSQINSKLIQGIFQILYKGSRALIKFGKYLNNIKLTNLMIINGWDLIFKCFLYLNSFENYSLRNLIQIVLAIFILASYGFIIFCQIRTYNYFKKSKKIQYLEQQYEAINLIKQIILLFTLIFIYQSEIIQIALLLANSLISIIVILNKRKYIQFQNFISLILQEGLILLFIFTSLAYTKDFSIYLSSQNKILLGWIHIFLFSFILVLPIIKQAINLIFKIYKSLSIIKKQQSQINILYQ